MWKYVRQYLPYAVLSALFMAGEVSMDLVQPGILMLTMLFRNISRGLASWKRLKEILYSEPQLTDGRCDGKTDKHGEIEFRDVSFT